MKTKILKLLGIITTLVMLVATLSILALPTSAATDLPYLNVSGETLIYDGKVTQNTVPNVTFNYDKTTNIATLTLNGVQGSENSNGYGIEARNLAHLNIVLAEGSANLFDISWANADRLALISATCPVTISGNGSLTGKITNKSGSTLYGSAPIADGIRLLDDDLLTIRNAASVDLEFDVSCETRAVGINANTAITSGALYVKISNQKRAVNKCLNKTVTLYDGLMMLTPGTNTELGDEFIVQKGAQKSTQDGTTSYSLYHSWEHSTKGNVLTAWCDSTEHTDCNYYGEQNAVTLTFNAEDAAFAVETVVTETTIMGTPITYVDTLEKPYNNASIIMSDPVLNGANTSAILYSTANGTAPTEVGEYTASITYKGNTLTDTFKITKAELTEELYTAPTPINGLIYTGEAHTLIDAGSVKGTVLLNMPQDPFGTMVYSLDGESYSEELPTAVDAGTYTVYYKVLGDANHNDSEPKTVSASIGKATALPTVNFPTASDSTYGDTLGNIALNGGSTELGTFAWKDPSALPTVSNNGYAVVFTPSELALKNYEGLTSSEQTVPVKVAKKEITVTANSATVCVGGDHKHGYTVSGLVGSDKLLTEPTVTTDADLQKAGEYAVTVSGATASENYTVTYANGKLTVRDHSYSGVVTSDPTCSAEGVKTYICAHDASHVYTEPIPVNADAHTDANNDHVCDGCGAKLPKDGPAVGVIVAIIIGSVAILGIGGYAILRVISKKKKA